MSSANPFEPPKAALDVPRDEGVPALWNPDAAGAWSLLFTPVFGSVLVRENWKALGEPEKARTGAIWIAVSVVMLIPVLLLGFTGLLYIVVWYFGWQRQQTTYIQERWGNRYPRKGWGIPVFGALLAGLCGTFLLLLIAQLILKA